MPAELKLDPFYTGIPVVSSEKPPAAALPVARYIDRARGRFYLDHHIPMDIYYA